MILGYITSKLFDYVLSEQMVSLRVLALLSVAVSALASPLVTRDVVTVKNDINLKIWPEIVKLSGDVNGFPASGLIGATV